MIRFVTLGIQRTEIAGHKYDPGRTRTCNLWFRRPTPYPLGHRARCNGVHLESVPTCVNFLERSKHQLARRGTLEQISVDAGSATAIGATQFFRTHHKMQVGQWHFLGLEQRLSFKRWRELRKGFAFAAKLQNDTCGI